MISFDDIQFHEDDRAQRAMNVFKYLKGGQINVSYVNSTQHVVAWHKHNIQTDYWFCVKGAFKVGLAEETRESREQVPGEGGQYYETKFEYLSDKNPRVLVIPPGVYHGYKALEPGSIMLYYLSEQYDPNDELRAEVGAFGEDWGTENK
jgi:dTDP-4-dehydrorhamnose 3,5-epimerase